jgi:hypothetical protein
VTRPNAALVLVVSLAVLGALTGCTGLGGREPVVTPLTAEGAPWNHKEAAQKIRSIPGVVDASIAFGPDGIPGQNSMTIGFELAADYPDELLVPLTEFLLSVAWSIPEDKPSTTVDLGAARGEGWIDFRPATRELGLRNDESIGLTLGAGEMAEHYGDWPLAPPVLPAALAEYVPATRVPVPEPSPAPTP